jgi:hypothetical protein
MLTGMQTIVASNAIFNFLRPELFERVPCLDDPACLNQRESLAISTAPSRLELKDPPAPAGAIFRIKSSLPSQVGIERSTGSRRGDFPDQIVASFLGWN